MSKGYHSKDSFGPRWNDAINDYYMEISWKKIKKIIENEKKLGPVIKADLGFLGDWTMTEAEIYDGKDYKGYTYRNLSYNKLIERSPHFNNEGKAIALSMNYWIFDEQMKDYSDMYEPTLVVYSSEDNYKMFPVWVKRMKGKK